MNQRKTPKNTRSLRLLLGSACIAVVMWHPVSQAADNLMAIYDLAIKQDPQLRAAAANRLATLETRPQARAALLPQINATGSRTWADANAITTARSDNLSLQLNQSIYNHQNYANLKSATAQGKQASFVYQAAEQDLIIRVTQAYFAVLAANDNLEFSVSEKKAISRQLEQANKRYDVGLIAITDVHEAQARYDLSVADEINAQNTIDSALESLREITGQAHNELVMLGEAIDVVDPVPADMGTWSANALENNPTLLAQQQATEAARQNAEVQRSGHYPTLDLIGTLSSNQTNNPVFDRDSNSLRLQLSVPIFTGNATSSRTRQAEYQLQSAQEATIQTRRAVTKQTADAYRGVLSSIARINALSQAVTSNNSALTATEAGFEVGTRTIVDVLNALRGVHGAVRDLKRARYDYLQNTLSLKQAAGSLSSRDIEGINDLLQ